MEWSAFAAAILGAITGGAIAGFFSLKATQKSHDNQKQQADENEAKMIKGLLQAIHDEIETLFDRYQETMGGHAG